MIDTHGHLNFHAFEDNHTEVVARAKEAGLSAVIVPSTYLGSSQQAIRLAGKYPGWLWPAVGHHPIHVNNHLFDPGAYRVLASNPVVVAIGEIGLDAYRDEERATFAVQKDILRQQLDLALELEKPVILHCRNAYDELLELLRAMPKLPTGVLHCFAAVPKAGYQGNTPAMEIAQSFLDLGYSIGFTGILTYPGNDALRDVVKNIPVESILLETDSPYLAPQKYRGQPNEPAYVTEVATEIARVRGVSIEAIDRATTETAHRVFALSR